MAAPSFAPPVTFDFRSGNGMLRFCETCRVATHSSTLLNPAHASCADMPAGTMAASRVLCPVDALDCAVAAGAGWLRGAGDVIGGRGRGGGLRRGVGRLHRGLRRR